MKKNLYISELAKLFGITPTALRKYEKQGLVSPVRDQENQYREYSSTDLIWLFMSKRSMRNGFTISETADILSTDTLEQISLKMEEKEETIAQELLRLEATLSSLQRWRQELNAIKIGEVHVEYMPECYYMEFLHGSSRDILDQRISDEMLRKLLLSERTNIGIRIPRDAALSGGTDSWGGLVEYPDREGRYLLMNYPNAQHLPKRLCACVNLYGRDSQHIAPGDFLPPLNYIQKMGASLCDDVYGVMQFYHYASKERHFLHKYYFPIQQG